jgi:hypothetical protein
MSEELLALGRFDADDRAQLRRDFDGAEPFPHLVLSNILTVGPEILSKFPDTEWSGWLKFEDEYQPGKLFATELPVVPEPFRRILIELNSRAFLVFLEEVTGIKGLIPDPYFEGGGLHSSGPGGLLRPHTDFHIYPRLRLYRHLNALLYLNPGWQQEFGGLLELYDDKTNSKVKEVVPEFGTMVLFRTDDRSVHGFSEPVRDGHRRNSIATYYYTSEEAGGLQWRLHHLLAHAHAVEGAWSRSLRRLPRTTRRVALLLISRPSGQSAPRHSMAADRLGRAATGGQGRRRLRMNR